jgi:beta-glucoside operon transcriptional antiterminator
MVGWLCACYVPKEFFMLLRVIKKINNNVALATDESGAEVVIFGRGVGFPHMPYTLRDERRIQRIFRDVSEHVAEAAATISDEVLVVSSDIVDLAKVELSDLRFSPNLVFTLADHLQFAVERTRENITIENPLAADVAYVYPREYGLGKTAIGMVKNRVDVTLPATEACSVALHLVSGEAGECQGDMDLVVKSAKAIEKITDIVEGELDISIDRNSYAYVRFVAHLRFLMGRLFKHEAVASENGALFEEAAKDFPRAYACARKIDGFLKEEYGTSCTNEEILYLMMHIGRLATQH